MLWGNLGGRITWLGWEGGVGRVASFWGVLLGCGLGGFGASSLGLWGLGLSFGSVGTLFHLVITIAFGTYIFLNSSVHIVYPLSAIILSSIYSWRFKYSFSYFLLKQIKYFSKLLYTLIFYPICSMMYLPLSSIMESPILM